ncbi:MAG: hypothetical protein Q9209_006400 [Squamulea sp. 1 TL-2023]
MRVDRYLTAALSMYGVLPGRSVAVALPPKHLDPNITSPVKTNLISKRVATHHCRDTAENAAFFERTPGNWRASDAANRYKTLMSSLFRTSEWTDRETEPSLFARHTIGWDDLECGVSFDGCHEAPSCDEVLTALGGDRDEARWVWFILESINNVALVSSVVDKQTVRSQIDLAPLAESAAHTFYWKYDESVQNKCKIFAGLAKAAILSAFVFLGALVPATAPAVAGVVPAVGASAAGSSAFLAGKGATVASFALNFASNFPTNVAGDKIEASICDNFANADPHLEEEARMQIKRDIGRFYQDYRTMIQSSNNDIIKGTRTPFFDASTLLADVIASGQPGLLEDDMLQFYKNALISTILKSQMCYIECSAEKTSDSDRTSFEPEPGKFCSAKCWQNWSGEKTLHVFGLDELSKSDNEWNIEIQAFLRASFKHYRSNGFREDNMLPSIEELFDDEVKPSSASFLPVCDSYLSRGKNKKGTSGIPCMCGDEYGSETVQFWKAANFDSWEATRITGNLETERGPPYLCKNDMAIKRTPPVDYFLNMCNMNWRWPTLTDRANRSEWNDYLHLHRGQDVHCPAFKSLVEGFNILKEANLLKANETQDVDCHMCYENIVGQDIQSGPGAQVWEIENLFWIKSPGTAPEKQNYRFQRACELMDKKC